MEVREWFKIKIASCLIRLSQYKKMIAMRLESTMSWVYVLELVGGRFYVGFSENVARRIQQHIDGRGAQATKQAPVVDIHSITKFKTREDALLGEKAEYRRQCTLHGKHKVSMGQQFKDLVPLAKSSRKRNWVPRYVFQEYFMKRP